MTTFQLKLLAAILMVFDHLGAILFPEILAFRFIGRLSFPLFAWLVGQGEKHTRNFNNYLLRLIICGIVSQPIYYFLFRSSSINILATLALGLLAVRLGKLLNFKFIYWCIFAALAELAHAEYRAYGVFVITLLSEFNSTSITWWLKWNTLNLLTLFIPGFFFFQFLALLTPIIIILWNGKQGRKTKWFYLFYPFHLALILLLRLLVTSS